MRLGRSLALPTISRRLAWFKSLRARVTLFSMDGGVVPAVNDGRTRPSRQSGPTLYTAKCYPGLNQARRLGPLTAGASWPVTEWGATGMTSGSTRRHFLEVAGAAAGTAGLVAVPPSHPVPQATTAEGPNPKASARPKVAALASVYSYLSHAYHIVGRFLDGFPVYDGGAVALHRPPFEIASLFIEQAPAATDLGQAKARRHGVRLSPTIADALTLGTGKLAVDAVLLIAEHGEYPLNARMQKLYPRGRFFREVLEVVKGSG